MKRIAVCLFGILLCLSAFCQESSIEEAVNMMKETSAKFLKGEFTKVDATGIKQYVDVEITGVHNFSDFSNGAVLPFLKKGLEESASMYKGNRTIEAENKRILEYAENNKTKIVSYAAIVDYDGITKYHEKESMSNLFFFDRNGNLIGIRNSDFERGSYVKNLWKTMWSQIEEDLSREYDPLFLPYDRFVSETITSTIGKTEYKMTWCFDLYRNAPGDVWPHKGEALIRYYQVQDNGLVSKSLTYIDCQYEWNHDEIEFTFPSSDIELYLVQPEYVKEYDPEDFSNLHAKSQLSYSILNTPKIKKIIRAANSKPKEFVVTGDASFKMSVPLNDLVFEFSKVNHMDW